MSRHFHIAAAFLMLTVAAPAPAEDPTWPPGSAMHTAGLHAERLKEARRTLETLEGRLLALASSPDDGVAAALTAQQAAWKRYVPQECDLIGALTGSGGSWPTSYNLNCQANLMELRVRRTRAAIDCIERIPAEKRPFLRSACLYQLTPLAVPLR
jgi:hypothetical protein